MKKVTSMFLTLIFVCSLILPYSTNAEETKENVNIIQGKTYLNLDKQHFEGDIVDSEMKVDNIVVNKSLIRIKGNIFYEGKSIPINIKGEIKESKKLRIGITGKLQNQGSDLEVVHFSIADYSRKESNILFNDKNEGKILRLTISF